MLSKRWQRNHSFLEPLKLTDSKNQLTSGTLSPATITTTSSGYSTGGSSVSTKLVPPLKDHNQHKIKSKSFHNFLTKLKSFIISPKTKLIPSTISKEMSSTNILRQYSTSYNLPLSSIKTSNTISLPFTYYHNSPIKKFQSNNKTINESYVTKATNFDKISAWLDHTEMMIQNDNDLLFIDESQQQSISSSPIEIDYQLIMKKTPSTIRTPRRSTSMVSTMTRPIIEQKQYEKTISPTSSFSSSILARGMSESMTPQKTYHLSRTNVTEDQKNILLPKSNRRRAIDFSRRRTVAGPTEQINNNNNNNKENFPINRRQQIYRFSPSTSNNIVTKKYYFHSNPPVKTEDILMNSYGLTLLQQQQQQKRQSIPASMTIPNISENISIRSPPKQLNHRPSIHLTQSQYTSDSLEDLLCDREVESYFYPNKQQAPTSHVQHIYINLETPPNYYQPTAYLHGTLC